MKLTVRFYDLSGLLIEQVVKESKAKSIDDMAKRIKMPCPTYTFTIFNEDNGLFVEYSHFRQELSRKFI